MEEINITTKFFAQAFCFKKLVMHILMGICRLMTPRERIITTLSHQEPDRVPINFHCGDAGLRRMIESADIAPEVKQRFIHGDVDILTFEDGRMIRCFPPIIVGHQVKRLLMIGVLAAFATRHLEHTF